MIEDHLGVVDETGAAAELAHSRLWELLDREILPCLERPGRQLGPYDLSLRADNGHSNVALIFPSVHEGVQAPAALRPLFEYVAPLRTLQPSLACAPATDLEQMLDERSLPLFGRPQWTPLAEHALWIAVLVEPLDLLGLLTVLRSARVPMRACDRAGGPVVLLTGDGAERMGPLARVFADVVVDFDLLTPQWFARLDTARASGAELIDALLAAGLGPRGQRGALKAPGAVPATLRAVTPVPSVRIPRRGEVAGLLVRGRSQLRRPVCRREAGRSTAFTDRLWVGSASARLRAELGLVDAATLVAGLNEAFAAEAGAVALDFVWGLPGETDADRAALAPMLDAIVEVAPRGVRQVRVRLGWYVPSGAERAAGEATIGSSVAEASLARLHEALRARRLNIDTLPPARAVVASLLEAAPVEMAPVLEAVHAAGARTADDALACDMELWNRSLAACGQGDGAVSGVAALDAAMHVGPATHGLEGKALRSLRGLARVDVPRKAMVCPPVDRWTRWQALVPRQFEVRIEFAKVGRARLLGPGELTDLFLVALERAGIALATTGVVEPKPRISFGPSLPAGVAGEREVVDLGLLQQVPDLLERLRPELPEEIQLRAAALLPPHAPQLALGHVALAEYAVEVAAQQFIDPQAQASSLEILNAWRRRIQSGQSCVDDPADVLRQLRDLDLRASAEGGVAMRFVLDLRDSGPKCKPRDVLARGLTGLVVDVRCLPLRRLRLLMLAEEPGHVVPVTPLDRVRQAVRLQRARAKFSA